MSHDYTANCDDDCEAAEALRAAEHEIEGLKDQVDEAEDARQEASNDADAAWLAIEGLKGILGEAADALKDPDLDALDRDDLAERLIALTDG